MVIPRYLASDVTMRVTKLFCETAKAGYMEIIQA